MRTTQKTALYIVIVGIFIASSIYIVRNPSPNECFVREMREWGGQERLLEVIGGLIQEDEDMAVARAKTVIQNYKPSNLNEEDRKVYDAITTRFTYCGVSN